MKLFDYYRDYDFGHDIYLIVGQFKNFNILDGEFHTTEYWSWEPDIRFAFGVLAGALFSIDFRAWSFSFSLALIPYRLPSDLSHTREL